VSILSFFIVAGGFLLFIVPGIILAVWFSLALYVLVSEDLKGMNALFRSKQLVSGYWSSVFGRIILLTLVSFAIMIPLIVAAVIIGGTGFLFDAVKQAELASSIVYQPLATLYQWLIAGFGVAFWFLLYEDLKRVKGNPAFEEPSSGAKWKYIAIGIVPIFIGLAVFVVLFVGGGDYSR